MSIGRNKHSIAKKRPARKPAVVQQPPLGRRERRAVQTRIRLFRCALALIARRGAANVTVEDITEAADVGKGTFFNYFQSKDHVLGVMAEIQLGKVREAAALASRRRMPIRLVLRRLMLRLAEEPGRNPRLARALLSSFLASREVRGILKRNMQQGRKAIGEIVAAGQKNGEIDPQLRKDQIAFGFLQTVLGTILYWSLHEKPRLKTWMEGSFQRFWRSIEVPGKGDARRAARPSRNRRNVKR